MVMGCTKVVVEGWTINHRKKQIWLLFQRLIPKIMFKCCFNEYIHQAVLLNLCGADVASTISTLAIFWRVY